MRRIVFVTLADSVVVAVVTESSPAAVGIRLGHPTVQSVIGVKRAVSRVVGAAGDAGVGVALGLQGDQAVRVERVGEVAWIAAVAGGGQFLLLAPGPAQTIVGVAGNVAAVIDVAAGVKAERVGNERPAPVEARHHVVATVVFEVARLAERIGETRYLEY